MPSLRDVIRQAEEMQRRYDQRIANQRDSITRLLSHEGPKAAQSTSEIARLNDELAAVQVKLETLQSRVLSEIDGGLRAGFVGGIRKAVEESRS